MLRAAEPRPAPTSLSWPAALLVLAVGLGDLVLMPLIQLRAATVVMLAVAALALWTARSTRWRRAAPIALLLLAVTLAAWIPLALGRAPDAGAGRSEVQGLLAGVAVATAVVALSRGTARGLASMRVGWALALLVAVGVCVVELVTDSHLWVGPGLAWAEDRRTVVAGAFRNPNDFAFALTMMAHATLTYTAALERRPRLRGALFGLAALGVSAILLTESRSGLLALLCVGALWAWSWARTHHRAPSRRGMAITGALVALAALAAFVVPPLAAHNPVLRALRATAEAGTARSDQLRLDLLRAGLRYFGESDGLGTGAASFESLLAADPHPGVSTQTWLHNSFLEILLQYGVIVGGALALVLVTTLVVAWRSARTHRGPAHALARLDLGAALIVFIGLGFASATVVTSPLWWAVLGHAVAAAWLLQAPPVSPHAMEPPAPSDMQAEQGDHGDHGDHGARPGRARRAHTPARNDHHLTARTARLPGGVQMTGRPGHTGQPR